MKIYAQLLSDKGPLSKKQEVTFKFHQVLGVFKLKDRLEIEVTKSGFATHYAITNEENTLLVQVPFYVHVSKGDYART